MKLDFEEHGSGSPVVLLHAFPLSKKMWSENIESIVDLGFRLILPDLRGFGNSPDFSEKITIEAMARDVDELLNFLKIEKAIIGGLSMGGYVAFNLYRLSPQKFAGLILCDTNAAADTEEKRNLRFKLIEKIESQGTQALIENMLPNLIGEYTKTRNRELIARLKIMFAETKPEAAISALRAMAERQDQAAILEKINIPTVLIFGEEDQVTNLQTARSLHAQIKNSVFYTIKNAGHYSNMEQPEQFNKILISFLQEVKI